MSAVNVGNIQRAASSSLVDVHQKHNADAAEQRAGQLTTEFSDGYTTTTRLQGVPVRGVPRCQTSSVVGTCRAVWIPAQFTWVRRALTALILCCLAFLAFCLIYTGNQTNIGFHLGLLPWHGMADVKQRLPQAIIVGVRKCGTRALLEFLSVHPDVCHAHEEVHFFDRESRYHLGLEWYRKQMPLSTGGQVTIEKTPGYFIAKDAPALIRRMNSSVRLLVIVRDPVTRVISDYTQTYSNRMKRNLSYTAFEELVIEPSTGDVSTQYKPIWISLYYVHFMHWLAVFNRSQIHLVDGDSLVENPIRELRKAESFLGLRHALKQDNFYFNKTRGFFCLKKGADLRCLHPSKGRAHPPIKPRVLHKLYKFFKPYNEKFFKLSGQYFDWSEEKRRKKRRSI